MPSITSVPLTGDPYLDSLLYGSKWNVKSLTYSFPTDPSFYGTTYGSGETTKNFEAFTPAQQAAIRTILGEYSSIINLTFTEVQETSSTHGDLRYAESDAPTTAWAYYPTSSQVGGDAWFNNSSNKYDNPLVGNYSWYTMLHETGHALGLKHPHQGTVMPLDKDSIEYTVMSYRSYVGASTSGLTVSAGSYPQSLMMYDIAALQTMYGANYKTNSGDTVYSWDLNTGCMYVNNVALTASTANKIFRTIWDGGGNDTYDCSNYLTNLNIDLRPGSWSTFSTTQLANLGNGHLAAGNVANALMYGGNTASLIENAKGGSGHDKLVGNVVNNMLTGGGGNDYLDGREGEDTACYSGAFGNYSIVYNLDLTWTISDNRAISLDGIDQLVNIEWVQFYDIRIKLDATQYQPTIQPPSIAALLNDSEIAGDRITSNNSLSLSGIAAALSSIKIYAGTTLLGATTADSAGNWSFTSSALTDGAYQLTATATDSSGTTSAHSAQFSVTVDTLAPITPQISGFGPDSNVAGDRITNATSLTLQGSAEANSRVHLYDGTTLLGTTTANSTGQWTFSTASSGALEFGCACAECAAAADAPTTNVLADGTHMFSAVSKDIAGNTSGTSSTFQVIVDTVAPAAPVISGVSPDSNVAGDRITNASQLTLNGTAEAGATVKVFDGAALIKTLTADAQGNWNFTTSSLSNAVHDFTATATDKAGNTSTTSSSWQVTVDTVAPLAPTITSFTPDSGATGDGVTNSNQITIKGVAEVGSIVKIYDAGVLVQTVTADATGAWSVTTSALTSGTHTFTATATDKAGNVSASSGQILVTIDTIAPSAPVISSFTPDTGIVGDGVTGANQITLTGSAEAGSTVKIYDGSTLIKTVAADASGAWSVTTDTLTNATHSFTATASDRAGNTSGVSTAVQVTVNAVNPPDAPIITKFTPDSGTVGDGVTNAGQITVEGSAAPNSTVKIFDGGTLIKTLSASSTGGWSFTTNVLADGEHNFTATASDSLGNVSVASAALKVVVDTVAPTAPVISSFSPDTGLVGDFVTSATQLTLSGTAAAGSTVKVYDGNTLIKTVIADSAGKWSFLTSELTASSHNFTATATDQAGNISLRSNPLDVTVVADGPSVPTVTSFSPDSNVVGDGTTNANKIIVAGTADAGSSVTLYDGQNIVATVVADATGQWVFSTATLIDGAHAFTAIATNAAGVTSGASSPLIVNVDTVAPNAPVISSIQRADGEAVAGFSNSSSLVLKGTGEAGGTVVILDQGIELGRVTVDGSGAWSFTTPVLTDGSHSLVAVAYDIAGNKSVSSTSSVVRIDSTPPETPSISGFSPDSATAGDGITNVSSVKLFGRSEVGSVVRVYDGASFIGEAVTDRKGAWSLTTTALVDGNHAFSATAVDSALNASAASAAISVKIDTVAPDMPQLLSYSPGSGSLGFTNSKVISLVGAAEAGSLVKVYNNGKYLGVTTADADGAWSFTTGQLSNATHRFTATATDAAGNTSPLSSAAASKGALPSEIGPDDRSVLVVTVDATAPKSPKILSFSNDTGRAGDGITADSTPQLAGLAEAGSLIKIYDRGTLLGTASADGAGAWSFECPELTDGAYALTCTATDAAGNESTATREFRIVVDTTSDAPLITGIAKDTGVPGDFITNVNKVQLLGTGEANSSISIYSDGLLVGTALANKDGQWTLKVAALPDGVYHYTAIATDQAGNVSASSTPTVLTIDTIAPQKPTLDFVETEGGSIKAGITTATSFTFGGRSEAGSLVTIYDGKTVLGSALTDASGHWDFSATGIPSGKHKFTAGTSDLAGNTSMSVDSLSISVIAKTAYAASEVTGLTDSAMRFVDQGESQWTGSLLHGPLDLLPYGYDAISSPPVPLIDTEFTTSLYAHDQGWLHNQDHFVL